MTTPWNPSPNPGGQNERLVRTVLQQWLGAQGIAGLDLDRIYRADLPETLVDWNSESQFAAIVIIELGRVVEARMAYTGPTDPGGKDALYEVTLHIEHHCYSDDLWSEAQDDMDRMKDAIKDGLRAQGRDLGRPDVILQAGDWPAETSITTENDPAVWNGGTRIQRSRISFTVTQYMQRQP